MGRDQLRELCDHYDVVRARALDDLMTNLLSKLGTDIEAIVNHDGPWSRDAWNDFVEAHGGRRRRSFEEVADELRELLNGNGKLTEDSDSGQASNSAATSSRGNIHISSQFTTTREPPSIGNVVNNRYEIFEELGEGGFGAAYRVHDLRLPKAEPVVLKVAHDEEKAKGLKNEMEKALRVHHPNICRYLVYDECEDYGPFVVMEDGGVSVASITNGRAMMPRWLLDVGRQTATALDYIHKRGMIHGDVSPGNILLDSDGVARLADFGIAAGLQSVTRAGGGHTRVATSYRGYHPMYGAPEALHGGARPASDQFSLALVMLELLCGKQRDHVALLDRLPNLPPAWRAPFSKAASLSPTLRFSNCAEFVNALPTR
jgi:serine/threonine protein kinase